MTIRLVLELKAFTAFTDKNPYRGGGEGKICKCFARKYPSDIFIAKLFSQEVNFKRNYYFPLSFIFDGGTVNI